MSKVITIDGPASAGKGTLSRQLARDIGATHLDNGSVFRSASLALLNAGIDINTTNSQEVIGRIRDTNLSVRWDGTLCRVYVDEIEVTDKISDLEVGKMTSILASDREYFTALSDLTRRMASNGNFVSDGRAVGTFIFPNADLKFFITASPEIRARRRYEDLLANGKNVIYEEVLADVLERDTRDANREFCPLVIPEGAFVIDTSISEPIESLHEMREIVRDQLGEDFLPTIR